MIPRKRTPPFPKSLLDKHIEKIAPDLVNLKPKRIEKSEERKTLLEWRGVPFVMVPTVA
mgnify:CR=1 FL=1